ncbi:hypothetical protein IPL85_06125 [Candidatus Saccharibacteria bacterium]|nr:MAG: hypothetical protein IPL85_06125 [Candidatus Saccharibacteria bacterium]
MNKKRKIVIVTASALLVLLIGGTTALTLLGKETPLTGIVTNVQSSQCKGFAMKLLEAEKATNPFYRCEQETYKVADGSKSVARIYVVAGAVERQWEFECGFMDPCATYVGWFDDDGNLFDFAEPPDVANHDPAVYTLGCGQVSSSSIYDIEVKPKLVFERGKYWWKIDYNNTSTDRQGGSCKVSGSSLIGYKEVLSSVKAKYLFNIDNCTTSTPTPCQTAKAVKTKSVEPCKYNQQELNGTQPKYDYECIANYIAQTSDTALCGIEANYGKITCDNIVNIKQL